MDSPHPRTAFLLLALLVPFAGSCGSSSGDAPPTTTVAEETGDAPTPPGDEEPADEDLGDEDQGKKKKGRRERQRPPATPPAELLGERPHDSETLGALHGEIRFEGAVPERFPIGARKNKECLDHADVEHLSDIVIVRDGKLRYAFVSLRAAFDEIPPPPAEPAVMDQRGCIYTPHVLAMQSGQKLLVRNSDPSATHNVNVWAPRNNASRNVNMAPQQKPLEIDLERAETVLLKCDIHPWMEARVHVCDHPWFDVTDEEGHFEIPDIPPGQYIVEGLHERFGMVRGSALVRPGVSTGIALTFRPE